MKNKITCYDKSHQHWGSISFHNSVVRATLMNMGSRGRVNRTFSVYDGFFLTMTEKSEQHQSFPAARLRCYACLPNYYYYPNFAVQIIETSASALRCGALLRGAVGMHNPAANGSRAWFSDQLSTSLVMINDTRSTVVCFCFPSRRRGSAGFPIFSRNTNDQRHWHGAQEAGSIFTRIGAGGDSGL